jgi:exosortase C (VPDSG-CTERM-specific)
MTIGGAQFMPPDELPNSVKEQRKIVPKRLPPLQGEEEPRQHPVRLRGFMLAVTALLLCFVVPLCHLLLFAAGSALYSHILLIPLISAYLVWLRRRSLPSDSEPPRQLAVFLLITGFVVLVGFWLAVGSAVTLTEEDSLAFTTLSFLLFFLGVCGLFLGREILQAIAFPLLFLVFIVPFPTFLRNGIELMSQHSSAVAANVMFRLSGMPVFREELGFQLPGIRLHVDPECSGIHSSLVLFLTSLVAGHLFLHRPWTRTVLAAAMVPLAILRNGFRIFVIGQLCVRIGPEMLYSAIHRQGGPIFFALSLVPFFVLLVVLRRLDRAMKEGIPEQHGG